MIVLRTFLALAAGFFTMALMLALATASARWAGKQPIAGKSIGAMLWNLGTTLAAALCGGYLTTTLAVDNPLIHALALAIIVLLLSALGAMQSRGSYPIWFSLLMVATGPCAVIAGGLLRLKWMGL